MMNYKGFLDTNQRIVILFRHRREKDTCFSDRLKTILLLDEGYSFEQIAKILFRDDQTIRNYFGKFEKGGIEGLLSDKYSGYCGCLSGEEKRKLTELLDKYTYLDTNPIIDYVDFTFGKKYTQSGMRDLLHRLGFMYKKASHVPGKTDAEKQHKFITAFKVE